MHETDLNGDPLYGPHVAEACRRMSPLTHTGARWDRRAACLPQVDSGRRRVECDGPTLRYAFDPTRTPNGQAQPVPPHAVSPKAYPFDQLA